MLLEAYKFKTKLFVLIKGNKFKVLALSELIKIQLSFIKQQHNVIICIMLAANCQLING